MFSVCTFSSFGVFCCYFVLRVFRFFFPFICSSCWFCCLFSGFCFLFLFVVVVVLVVVVVVRGMFSVFFSHLLVPVVAVVVVCCQGRVFRVCLLFYLFPLWLLLLVLWACFPCFFPIYSFPLLLVLFLVWVIFFVFVSYLIVFCCNDRRYNLGTHG